MKINFGTWLICQMVQEPLSANGSLKIKPIWMQIHKARLVAKGFQQVQGIDYNETFSPVAMLKPVRIILAIDAYFDYEIWQMDVKTAFLNGNLEEDVYMIQPEGFVDPDNASKVCKL